MFGLCLLGGVSEAGLVVVVLLCRWVVASRPCCRGGLGWVLCLVLFGLCRLGCRGVSAVCVGVGLLRVCGGRGGGLIVCFSWVVVLLDWLSLSVWLVVGVGRVGVFGVIVGRFVCVGRFVALAVSGLESLVGLVRELFWFVVGCLGFGVLVFRGLNVDVLPSSVMSVSSSGE